MVDLGDNYGTRGRQTDEYGNPVYTATDVDDYGNPIYPSGATEGYGGVTDTDVTGTHGKVTDVGIGAGGHEQLRRSGVSSSSEEDEAGVRRKKKGWKEKIKEKLPGGHKDKDEAGQGYGTGQELEKKGTMEKIKEKLPGGGHKQERQTTNAVGYDAGHGTGYGGTHGTEYGGSHGSGPREEGNDGEDKGEAAWYPQRLV
ncbi:dehydrin DHN1-like [Aristolochia californica]|uniref:dehydrin DHN1-like n=1 Tax=Aristolochia californica TaxID=171875 RepID=UPI0035D81D53